MKIDSSTEADSSESAYELGMVNTPLDKIPISSSITTALMNNDLNFHLRQWIFFQKYFRKKIFYFQ